MGTIVRRNERSWAIELITEVNLMISGLDLKIKRAGGESTLSVNKKSMFPDVLLYGDTGQTKILQGWELKMPDVLITDQAFLADAMRKARALNLNSFFIWNFTYGKLYIKDDNDRFYEAKTWSGTSYIKTREDVTRYKELWVPVIRDVILEINQFLAAGKIQSAPVLEVLTDNLIAEVIERNKQIVSDYLRRQAARNMMMERKLKVWWSSFQEDYAKDEDDLYSAYAKVILLNWTNRVLFANLIRKYHNCARLIEAIDSTTLPEDGNRIIETIVEQGDFYHVFQKIDFNDQIPEDTWIDIVDYNQFLNQNHISRIDQSVLQDLLERTVAASKREIRGQFSTPWRLADLLAQITITDWEGHCADLCSGTGTIAKAILKNKTDRLNELQKTFETTWISDKHAYPLQISNIALTSVEAINMPLHLFQSDLFELETGKEFAVRSPLDGTNLIKKYPRLHAVVSNFPFVKARSIGKDEAEFLTYHTKEIKKNTGILFKTGKMDLSMFLPFKIHHLLEDGGKLGMILSNSWLGTDTGTQFFQALNYYYEVETIVLSNCGRWFANADVVATIVVLRKKTIGEPDEDHRIDFCLTQKELNRLNELEFETIISSIVLKEELDAELLVRKSYSLKAIGLIHQMGVSYNALFHDADWIHALAPALIPITQILEVKRGERRGWNGLFYPSDGHGIEEKYLKPVLKNPAKLTGYLAETDIEAFCCHNSKEELKELGHTGALAWIEKYQTIKNGTGKPLPEALYRPGGYWYEMDDHTKADFVTALNPNKRLFVSRFGEATFVDQRFTRLLVKDQTNDPLLLHALLNSVYGMFAIESVGFGRGLGVLDASSSNFKKIHMLNPDLISDQDKEEILALFEPVCGRMVKDTEDELNDPERRRFDQKVLEAFGLSAYYDQIKSSLLSMQRTRLTVAERKTYEDSGLYEAGSGLQ